MTSRRRFGGEHGITLVELLVVMALTAVVLGFVSRTVVHALGVQSRQTAQVAALNDTRVAFERVTRDIRGADPLRVTELDRISLDLRLADTTVRTVTYERDADRLVATDAGTGQSRALVGNLAPGQPLFLFHLADGSAVTGEAPVDPASVRSVTVRLHVENEAAGNVVDLVNQVLVRNAER